MDSLLNAMYAFAAAHVLLHAALLTPTSVLSHTKLAVSFVPLIWSCHFYAWNFGFGYISAIHALWSAELLLFRDPRKDFGLLHFETKPPAPSPLPAAATLDAMKDGNRREMNVASVNSKDGNKDKSKVITHVSHTTGWTEPYPQSLWKRFVWVSKLVLSLRYNGWVTSDSQKALFTSQLPPPRRSRLIFIIQKLCVVGCCFVVLDAVHYYQHFDPYMQIETSIDEAFPRRLGGFFARHYLGFLSPRCVRIMVFGLEQYCNFTLLGTTPAVVFVALGGIGLVDDFWGSVENWPLIHGEPLCDCAERSQGVLGRLLASVIPQLTHWTWKDSVKIIEPVPGINYLIRNPGSHSIWSLRHDLFSWSPQRLQDYQSNPMLIISMDPWRMRLVRNCSVTYSSHAGLQWIKVSLDFSLSESFKLDLDRTGSLPYCISGSR
ncbi:uncharacterized protein RAG0_06050 [Rhynchosporium agropyri]|uniref:Wax synthase domain-containing protein n=1 Tax=Rhynchosporium agropyri TaxID=914238 RepID=A0A1E1KFU8_9HELO|nr:uncharacterized protein RAG0_06050 [Rhynchosporium agropyri]